MYIFIIDTIMTYKKIQSGVTMGSVKSAERRLVCSNINQRDFQSKIFFISKVIKSYVLISIVQSFKNDLKDCLFADVILSN